MVTVVTLPPQETPKQSTAKRRPKDLEEMLIAFLNVNNKEGFVDDNKIVPVTMMAVSEIMALENATLSDLLMLLNEHESIRYLEFKKLARKIQTEINNNVGHKVVKLGRIFELLSRLFGYRTHAALCALIKLKNDGIVRNFRYNKNASSVTFSPEGIFKPKDFKCEPEVKVAFHQLRINGEEKKHLKEQKQKAKKERWLVSTAKHAKEST
jgi:hypothetical protein